MFTRCLDRYTTIRACIELRGFVRVIARGQRLAKCLFHRVLHKECDQTRRVLRGRIDLVDFLSAEPRRKFELDPQPAPFAFMAKFAQDMVRCLSMNGSTAATRAGGLIERSTWGTIISTNALASAGRSMDALSSRRPLVVSLTTTVIFSLVGAGFPSPPLLEHSRANAGGGSGSVL